MKASFAVSCAYHMDAASGLVTPDEITGIAPGLRVGTPLVVERVAKTVRERMSHKWPRVTQQRLVLMDATFDFRSLCIA